MQEIIGDSKSAKPLGCNNWVVKRSTKLALGISYASEDKGQRAHVQSMWCSMWGAVSRVPQEMFFTLLDTFGQIEHTHHSWAVLSWFFIRLYVLLCVVTQFLKIIPDTTVIVAIRFTRIYSHASNGFWHTIVSGVAVFWSCVRSFCMLLIS